MRLVWHIVGKDVRRVILPASFWLAIVVGSAATFRLADIGGDGAWRAWLQLGRAWSLVLMAILQLFCLVLVASVVLEDPLTGSRAFWTTRPISGARLLAAKGIGVFLMFILAPALVVVPVWIAAGFGGEALLSAIMGSALTYGMTVVLAFVAASLSTNLGWFLLYALAFSAVLGVTPGLVAVLGADVLDMAVRRSRVDVFQGTVAVVMLVVAAHQFMRRDVVRSWVLMALGLILATGVATMWRWDLGSFGSPLVRSPEVAQVPSEELSVRKVFGRIDSTVPTVAQDGLRVPAFDIRTPQPSAAGRVTIPIGGTGELAWSDGSRVRVRLAASRTIPDEVVRAALNEGNPPAVRTSQMRARRTSELAVGLQRGAARWDGVLELADYRRQALIELPLRAGAVAGSGPNRLRILEIDAPRAGAEGAVVLKMRDAWNESVDGRVGERVSLFARRDVLDGFALRMRGEASARVLRPEDVEAMSMASMVTGVVRLALPRDVRAEELEAAVLVRVRFELSREYRRAVSAEAVEIVPDKEP